MKPLSQCLFAIWDVETTGLDPAVDRVVEVGLVLCTPQEIMLRASLFVDPGMPIPPSATAVHGITDLDVAWAPNLLEALETMGNLMPQPPDFYVAHNARFDSAFLGLQERPWICTLAMSRQAYPDRSHRLMSLCQDLGLLVGVEQAHRAEGDAFAAARLLQEMLLALPELETASDLLAFGGGL